MRLDENDHVVGAWAEAPAGPGWSNRLIWVCIRNAATGAHRVDSLQPDEQSEEILLGFPMYLAASASLIGAVGRMAAEVTIPARRRGIGRAK